MSKLYKRSFIRMLILAVLAMTLAPLLLLQARPPKSEDELIANLASPKDKEVYAALQELEKTYPTDPKIIPPIEKLLADTRPVVRRKAARVLGAIHADVSRADIKNICELFNSTDKREIMDGLIALRGLKAQSAIPQILPLLDNPDTNVKRDSMRTLAVLGDSSLIPKIKPLLTYPDLAVQKDAADAISILKEK
jgi:HEAT repeat protein